MKIGWLIRSYIQCVSLDFPSFIIYPEIKARDVVCLGLERNLCSFYIRMDSPSFIIYPEIKGTKVEFSALNLYLCSFYFRITKRNWVNPKKHTVVEPLNWTSQLTQLYLVNVVEEKSLHDRTMSRLITPSSSNLNDPTRLIWLIFQHLCLIFHKIIYF